MGTNTELWGTPAFRGNGWDKISSTQTEMVCLLMKPNMCSSARKPSCQTRSKALDLLSESRRVRCWLIGYLLNDEVGIHIGCRSIVLRVRWTNVADQR